MSSPPRFPSRSAFSLIGLLVTMACIVVLFVILMNAMNKAVTGQGSQQELTLRSFEDKLKLTSLYQSMVANAQDNRGEFLVPAKLNRSNDPSFNTTANLFSAMVMQNYARPKDLISGNEYSGYVEECYDYDFAMLNEAAGVYWDPKFKADLKKLSHTSFAHMPLHGERLRAKWRTTMDSRFPLLGNRGPKDGIPSADLMSCGRDGVWRGHLVFGDGHVDFIESAAASGLAFERPGDAARAADNVFSMETGPNGSDAILSFTLSMTKQGPELQFD